ncbi:MAG: C40 family peptidase [Crocinitomicaceae bacterium]|nr:C40 family peptidase [Crocinitomicaceae bacterium]
MAEKFGFCKVSISPLRAENSDSSEMVSQLLFGEIVQVEDIHLPWMKITTFTDHYQGYVDVKHIELISEKEVKRWLDGLTYQKENVRSISTPWGNQIVFKGSCLPAEKNNPFNIGAYSFSFNDESLTNTLENPYSCAQDYLNTPYLWGGKSPFGIDCSGLTQVIFRFFDRNLPRDASQQVECGTDIEFEDIETGDLAFFSNKNGKIIHVGILNSQKEIIHASGWVRKDSLTKEGIIHSETKNLTHSLTCVKRIL